eukprot:13445164-Alexandrium_andersonii.AAC.1
MSHMSRCLSSHVCRHGVLACVPGTQMHMLSDVSRVRIIRCSSHRGRAQKAPSFSSVHLLSRIRKDRHAGDMEKALVAL